MNNVTNFLRTMMLSGVEAHLVIEPVEGLNVKWRAMVALTNANNVAGWFVYADEHPCFALANGATVEAAVAELDSFAKGAILIRERAN